MEIEFLRKFQNAATIWSFYFTRPKGLNFSPGDYAEVALPQAGTLGDKRWLSFANAPEEPELFFTVKLPPHPSDYKQALMDLMSGEKALLSPPIGTFNLPRDSAEKLLFVAGGVGIAPYRSMLRHLEAEQDYRDITLVYIARPKEFIFGDVLTGANIPILQTSDKIDVNWLKKRVPDLEERRIYLAGPRRLCEDLYDGLLTVGHDRARLELDYFDGYDEL